MKSLITVLTLVVMSFAAYPSVSEFYNDAIEFKMALKEDAKQACNNDVDLKWVKLKGSLEVFKCNELK